MLPPLFMISLEITLKESVLVDLADLWSKICLQGNR